jgi:MoCo/4Fe-4S cofactor protein with predicted Tat translocation signal
MSELDLSAIRARLASKQGPTYWRSLEELAETPEFTELIHREFPAHASEWNDPTGRRQFLKVMGASIALAGATACTRQPSELIVPYVKQPEEIVPGRPLFFATAMPHAGFATPVLAESHEGRPTKIEANPEHPATRGGTDVFAQGSLLTLYDPDRSKTIKFRGEIRPWTEFTAQMTGAIGGQKMLGGAGFRLLTETITSPTLAWQITEFLKTLPGAKWTVWDPITRDNARAGAKAALGQDVETRYRFENADVILALDSDLFEHSPGRLRYAKDFIDRRRLLKGDQKMNRLYAIESRISLLGAKADHRLPVKASDIEAVARGIASRLGVAGVSGEALPPAANERFIAALVKDLQAHHGRALVIAGDQQPASVHHLAHLMNAALGSVGQTVEYTAPVEAKPMNQLQGLKELAEDMEAGKVDMLVILSSNPVYTAPADLKFGERMSKVNMRVHLGLFDDETAELCHWHIPEAHYLEDFGDVRAFDGTVSIVQPLIAPLYDGCRSAHQIFAAFAGKGGDKTHDIVKGFWENEFKSPGKFGTMQDPDGKAFPSFDKFWRRTLHDGYIAGSALPVLTVTPSGGAPAVSAGARAGADAVEITFDADSTVYDGRFGNNGWLQETPKVVNKITWDNTAILAPKYAERLGLKDQQVIEIRAHGVSVRVPVSIVPGQPDQSINLQLGYGRRRAGQVGNGIGYNAYPLRTTDGPWTLVGAEVVATRETYRLAHTQGHFNMEGRHIVRSATLADYVADPEFAPKLDPTPRREETLHGNQWSYDKGYQWGMSIDTNACIGCNACMVSCTSENNISVVGKDQVLMSREMHWIRVDRYYEGDLDNPQMHNQPVPCQQCENAPCEVVCPVAATSHSSEGLNDMVYNRCVGTRYCSNNCPYKVRRFNFLLYADWTTPTLKMARNPDVTVRSRGVMEKCTYCVQRINHARIDAKVEDRTIRDGEVQTACQNACPVNAITFGNINDPEAQVTKLKQEPRNYGLLEELNTRPRTTYLASVRNPNPELEPAGAKPAETHGTDAH